MNMKTLLLSSVVLIAVSSVPARSADVAMEPMMHDWSGFYIGAHAGYGGADVNGVFDTSDIGSPDETFEVDGEGPFDLNLDGFVGGIQAGANWQSGSFVLGIEGDVSFVDWSDKIISDDNNDEQVWAETDFVATLRGRIGYAMDNLLLYGTAGAAFTDTEFTAEDDPADRDSVDLNDIGLVVGGGAEFALNESWSFKAEGLYFMFNDKNDTDTLTSDSDPGDFAELDDAWMARIGVNFHF